MDHIYEVSNDARREELNLAAKHRFESFRLGKDLSSNMPQNRPQSFHGRSHSRNNSFTSSTSSMPTFPHSSSANSVKSTTDMPSIPSTNSLPKKRPNSHHRRRSSVSTRHESAEIMGVSVPDLPVSSSEDNINLGEKDSIRRRALWALEGKPDLAFSKVEIPELTAPDMEKMSFDFSTKPSFPTGFGNGGLTPRDSFKLLGSSGSSKDQLHTLVEEEEEEEDESDNKENIVSSIVTEEPEAATPTLSFTKATPVRQRPTNLNLRPLSLTPENLIISPHGLPTPVQTPGSRDSFPLKSLTLINSISNDGNKTPLPKVARRHSHILTPSPTPPTAVRRQSSLNISCESPSPATVTDKVKRRSSISYRCSDSTSSTSLSLTGLPTPDGTPTLAERRISESNSDEDFPQHRPLSASEQHFLFKSHNALLARITDLERALSSQRSQSRPVSMASDTSSNATSEPSDEMLQLIGDLKAERDELKRDVDGWRMRVGDLDKQVGLFAKRVEAERRDAWVARSRVGLLEVEKTALQTTLQERMSELTMAMGKCDILAKECEGLRLEMKDLEVKVQAGQEAANECTRLRAALEKERMKREELERELDRADLLATPTAGAFLAKNVTPPLALVSRTKIRGLGFTSLDSECTVTDVGSFDGGAPKPSLRAVEEVDEEVDDASASSEEDNGLAGYEDEEDSDLSFQSPGSSSVGSMDEFPRSTSHLRLNADSTVRASESRSRSPTPPFSDIGHTPRASLSKTWTFPRSDQLPPKTSRGVEEVDRFFGCLDDLDNSPPLGSTHDNGKSLFSMGFGLEDNDELPPFVLPNDVGVEVQEVLPTSHSLEAVMEEDEDQEVETEEHDVEEMDDDAVFDEEISGIRITFTPPEPEHHELEAESPVGKPVHMFETSDDEDDETSVPFNFGRPVPKNEETVSVNCERFLPSKAESPVLNRILTSPSSIPRYSLSKTLINSSEVTTSTPPKTTSNRFVVPTGYSTNGFVTPPSKRGGMLPSFIPQPVSSSSPIKGSTGNKPKVRPSTTFIRQPQPASFKHGSTFRAASSNLQRQQNQIAYHRK